MQLENNFYYFQGTIPKETCEKIIQMGLEKNMESGTTGGGMSKTDKPNTKPLGIKTHKEAEDEEGIDNYYVRDSQVSWLGDKWLYDLICPYIYKANHAANWRFDIDWHEQFQFTTYQNTGFYGWHTDGGSDWNSVYKKYIEGYDELPDLVSGDKLPNGYTHNPNMIGKVRKISMTLNLTDPSTYDGGDLLFDFGNASQSKQTQEEIDIARTQGTIVVFPSFVRHCVSPVTRGTRYSLVNWSLGRPFR